MRNLGFLVLVGVLFGLSSRASAALILVHDNGGPNHPQGITSDLAVPFQAADDFVVSDATRVAKVIWHGAYSGGDRIPDGPDHFSVQFYAFSSATSPYAVPLFDLSLDSVLRTITPLTMVNGARIYSYEALLPEFDLLAGHYLISIVNNTSGYLDHWGWGLNSASGGAYWQRSNLGSNWSGPYGSELTFQIYAVPEPATGAMMGVAGLVVLRRRGRR